MERREYYYPEGPDEFSNLTLAQGSHKEADPSCLEPLDFSTRRERETSPSTRDRNMRSPESGVSSLGDESPPRMSPERREPTPQIPAHLFPFLASQRLRSNSAPGSQMDENLYPTVGWNLHNLMLNQGSSNVRSMDASSSQREESGAGAQLQSMFGPHSLMANQWPSLFAQLQQSGSLALSSLAQVAGQRVAEMTASPPGPSLPQIPQIPPMQGPQIPPVPFMGFPMAAGRSPFPGLSPVNVLHQRPLLSLESDDDSVSMTTKSNESYFKFRAEMLAKGQIGAKSRRNGSRLSSHGEHGSNPSDSGDDISERGEQRPREGGGADLQNGERLHRDGTKSDAYWERRRKNNEAAKRSRDARRAKEDEIAIRGAFLESENLQLRNLIDEMRARNKQLMSLVKSI